MALIQRTMRLFYCFCRIYRKCLLYIAFRLFLKVKQVFNISFRPLDGRKFQVLHFIPDASGVSDDLFDDLKMHGFIPDNALFPN